MNFLSILEKFVEEISGKDGIKLLNLMKEKDNISEFDFSENLKISINQIRNLLYKLNSYNLVYSTRKKDRDKGSYIYYWSFNFKHGRDLLISRKINELNNLNEELKKENEQKFYICKNDGIRLELEDAMEQEFKCTECESILQQEDSTKKIAEINHKITTLNQELEELKKPFDIMKPKEEIKIKKIIKKVKRKVIKKVKKKQVKKVKKAVKKIKKKSVKKIKKYGILKKLKKIKFSF
jgi:transcription factor E